MADAFSTTSRPVSPDSFMKRAGRALVGFGEGYMGRGQEYLEGLRAERERKNLQLADASIKDAMGVRRAIVNNDPQEAISILVDRANILDRMGEDSSDTLALRDLIASNNQAAALAEVDSFLSAAQRRGMIAAPAPIPSSQVTTGPSGNMGVVTQDPTTREYGFTTISGMADKPFDQSDMRVSDGRYISGPYIGMSPQRVAELIQTGQIEKLGDPLPSTATQPRPVSGQQQVRPPLRMPDQAPAQTPAQTAVPAQTAAPAQPAQYVDDPNLTSQENAFLRQEFIDEAAERTRAEEEAQRQRNEEARRQAQEERAASEAQREQDEATDQKRRLEDEMLILMGITDKLLDPSVYNDKVYAASTGAIEGRFPLLGAGATIGADLQDVTNFRNDLNYVQDLSTLENLGRMTGVLSESDLNLLTRAATGINLTSGAPEVRRQITLLQDKIRRKLIEMGLDEQQISQRSVQFVEKESEFDQQYNKFMLEQKNG